MRLGFVRNAIGTLAFGLGLLAVPQQAIATPIVYNVNQTIGTGSVVGTITTDGTLGVLSAANITDWTVTLSSPNLAGGSPEVITFGSGVSGRTGVNGSALSATLSSLIFDFSAGGSSYFLLQSFATNNAWCMTAGPITCAGETTPSEGIFFGTTTSWAELRNPTGSQVIASSVSSVPEPGSLLLLGTGLAALAVRRRLKKRA